MGSCCRITFLVLAVLFARGYYVFVGLPITDVVGHAYTAVNGFKELYSMPQDHIEDFFNAYTQLEKMDVGMPTPADKKAVHDYYRVLHRILAAGVVMEIMLVPPVIDINEGILKNLELWQHRMQDKLEVGPGKKVLDTGCGRGIIAKNFVERKGVSVVAINLDETQIESGKKLAADSGIGDKIDFHKQDYNDPFEFLEDKSVDGHYCAQACMFVSNKTKFMQHSARVLKPGSRFYGLEWVQLPNYDGSNMTHKQMVQKSATILGTSMPGPIQAWTDAFKANGFKILYVGHPTEHNSVELLERINDVYAPLQYAITWMGKAGLLGGRLPALFERLRAYWDTLRLMMQMELATPTYEFVAEKL